MPRDRLICAFCAISFLSASVAFAAAPEQKIYSCKLDVPATQNWVPEQIVVSVDEIGRKVFVFDPLISYFMSNPIQAQTIVDTSDRLTLKWNLKRLNKVKPSNMPTMVYTAKITKTDKRITINVTPLGYDNRFYAAGLCQVTD